jgi:TonB-dependent receptor
MRNALRSLLLLAIASLQMVWSIPVNAQGGKGVIAGTVKDSGGSVLTSALVVIQPLGKSAVSNDQGQFRIPDVPTGDYELSVTYVGFAAFSQKVQVAAGQTVDIDAALNVASQSDQVLVTAERLQGEAEAINITRTAEDIVQVLPSRVINSLPNTNIADAVGRLPSVTLERDEGEGKYVQIRGTEPRLSNTTIDGVNVPSPESGPRNVKLDVIPAALVDRIEVSKTLSANEDADAIGGSVNLVTRTAGNRPSYDFEGLGGYTPIQNGRPLDAFNGVVGRRFGSSQKLGFLFGGSYDHNDRGIDDVEPSQGTQALGANNIAITNGVDVRLYQYYRTRYGFASGLDYRISPGSSAYIKGLYSDFHDYGTTTVLSYNAGNATAQSGGITTFANNDGNIKYRQYIRRPDQQVYSFLTGARHDLTSTLITYEFAVSRGHQIGGFPTTYFNGPGKDGSPAVNFTEDNTDPYRPRFTALGGVDPFNAANYHITQVQQVDLRTTQLNFQGAASVARRYNWSSHLGVFELGFKVRNAHKTYNVVNSYFCTTTGINCSNSPDNSLTLDQGLSNFSYPGYYDGSYKLAPIADYAKLQNIFTGNPGKFAFDSSTTHLKSDPSDYDTNERITAGYLMNSINFGKFRLQTGLRFEATNANYTANLVTTDPATGNWASTKSFPGSGSYLNVLPSVQLQYQLEKNTNLRATYGIAISRPNFSDIVPSTVASPNNSPPTVVIGNPALKATRANDFDLLLEHFFQPLGILQAGFFYKQLTDPIYNTTQTIGPSNPLFASYPNYQLQQRINGPNAHITGFEVAWEQRLSRLPGLLNGFGVAANYSYTTSQVSFPTTADPSHGVFARTDHPALLRQAPNTWNLGMTYDKQRFSMRFGVSHNDANIFAYNYQQLDAPGTSNNDPILGLKGPNGDLYLYAHTQFDVQGEYRLYKGLRFVASGLNLSNEVFGFYQGSKIYPVQREYYHPSVILGMRWVSSVE